MRQALQQRFLPKGLLQGAQQDRKRSLLLALLILIGAGSLPFYVIHHPSYNHLANLVGTLGYWVLGAGLMLGVATVWITHAMLLWSLLYVAYLAALTGGINSPVMVWMTVAVLPAILLLERRHAAWWCLAVLGVELGLFTLGHGERIDTTPLVGNDVMAWAVTSKLMVIMMVMYVVFVTEQMHRQQTLAIDQNNLELEKTHQALLRAQAHKDEFIASVGHELRTPMNGILGLNEILRNELADRPEDAALVDHMRHATERLLQVVNDILDFSQLEAGRLTLFEEPFALWEALRWLEVRYAPLAQAKQVAFGLHADALQGLWVNGDRQRLLQVLGHLLDNALKFTDRGSITLRAARVGERGVRFEVQDTGIGIAHDRHAHIFQGFEQADAQTNRQYGGAGLGLSICDRLVRLQGGAMGVESARGQGALFWVELTLTTVAQNATTPADPSEPAWTQRALRILLVDDNPLNLMVAQLMLKKCLPLADVVQARNGAQALEQLQSQACDVVLMDLVMPEMNGIQTARVIRQTMPEPLRHVPIVALTANANPVDQDRCLAAGMNAVLVKPLDAQHLVSTLAQVLRVQAYQP